MADQPVKVLILGDSHSIALKDGCDMLGREAELLSFSGNLWHAGLIAPHRRFGLWSPNRGLRTRITTSIERLGQPTLFAPDVFVIATFGFHLGRLVPLFGMRGHRAQIAQFDELASAGEEVQFASRALVAAYADHFRSPHLTLMRWIARRAPMILVTPPRYATPDPNRDAFFDHIAGSARAIGIPVFDPCRELFPDTQAIPPAMLAADNSHGTRAYGKAVIKALTERKLIPAAA